MTSLDSSLSNEFVDVGHPQHASAALASSPELHLPHESSSASLERAMAEVLSERASPSPGSDEQPSASSNPVNADEGEKPQALADPTVPENASPESGRHQQRRGSTPSSESQTAGGDYTAFDGVTYLGAAVVNAPRSEVEVRRNVAVLNACSQQAIRVCLMIPNASDGLVRLCDHSREEEIATFKLHQIVFCARGGPAESAERNCLAFTCSHGESAESVIFHCHVFRCELPEAVGKILYCFSAAFHRIPKRLSTSRLLPGALTVSTMSTSMSQPFEDSVFNFEVAVEIKEEEKGSLNACPNDKGVFKIRKDLKKLLIITIIQTSNRELKIDRCFGVLLCPGRNIKHSDMNLLELASMGCDGAGKGYMITASWDPLDPNFAILNDETSKDVRVFMTIAVDLVIDGIKDPVRFCIECRAQVFGSGERFWYFTKRQLRERFTMTLKESCSASPGGVGLYEMKSLVSDSERERSKKGLGGLSLAAAAAGGGPYAQMAASIPLPSPSSAAGEDDDSGDEPIVSGSGAVSKDIADDELLAQWYETLRKWNQNFAQRPKQIKALCWRGVPEALRGEVWQLLAGCHDSSELTEAYRILMTKESPCEQVILRDIHRTFPAHEHFKEAGGVGQDSLYKIAKAYSIYDNEVGYCQGLTFIVAALLLHMPEEQAFAVLVKMMFDYDLRHFFKDGFEDLQLRFYQLERLMQVVIPDVWSHLLDMNLEAHMYASQWFLTVFTAKFPLFMVYHIMDVFLCDGINIIFNVALALLKDSRKELLSLDFEGMLKYFRVSLPKKYRQEAAAVRLIELAAKTKVSSKKLLKYEKEYAALRAEQIQQEDPVERLERENKNLMENNMRLEQENDLLAHELVNSKISLRNDLDTAEDSLDALNKNLIATQAVLDETREEKARLEEEANQVKARYRAEMERVAFESKKTEDIIAEYKQICTRHSERLESGREEIRMYKSIISGCECCSNGLSERLAPVSGDASSSSGQELPYSAVHRPVTTSDAGFGGVKLIELGGGSEALREHVRALELELASTKLALVESECRGQALSHQISNLEAELLLQTPPPSKSKSFHKSLTSLWDAMQRKGDNT